MRIIEQLVYKITGDNSEFDKSINQSETKVSKFGSVADKIFAGVTVAAIGMAIKKMGEMVMASANALDRVDKLSQKIGLSRTAFQEWDYILGQSGASVEGLQMSLKTLSGAADEASKGNKQYKDSFDKLGVSVTDANGNMKDQETLFNEVFSALADMENQTERTALASDLLGRSATELAPTLNTSKEGIEQLRSEAHSLGLVYSDELVDAGVILGDNIDRLKKSFGAFKTNALAPIIGLAVAFTDKILGQDSASKNLKSTYNDLQTAVTNYNTVLEASKGKTDAVTQATLSQAKAQLELALQKVSENYKDATKEIEKYRKTIATSDEWIERYNGSLREYADGTGYTADALNAMTEKERTSIITAEKGIFIASTYNIQLKARLGYQEDLLEATTNLSQAEATQAEFKGLLIQGYIAENEMTMVLLDMYPKLKAEVIGKVEAYKKEKEAIEARNKAISQANEDFKEYSSASDDVLRNLIAEAEKHKDSAYYAELHRLATEKLNASIAANAEIADKQTAIMANHSTALKNIEAYEKALGDSYDENSEKASLYTSTIKALIDSGLTAEDKAVADLTAQLEALGTATEGVTDATAAAYAEIEESRMSDKEKALKAIQDQADAYTKAGVAEADVAKWKSEQIQKYQDEETRTRADAYKLLESYSLSEKDKAIANIQAQADKFLEAGVSIVDVATWQSNELDKLAKQNEKSWNDALESIAENGFKSFISGFEDIGKAIGEGADVWKAFQAMGLNAIASIVEALGHELAARAIISLLAGDWTGFGLATAGSISAYTASGLLKSQIPSYDVGSIRIPETTQAVVHKDEMILTAPQAEQARREGITIAPNKSSGNSVNLVIYLDGKEIARSTLDNINSGAVGTIKARVVK